MSDNYRNNTNPLSQYLNNNNRGSSISEVYNNDIPNTLTTPGVSNIDNINNILNKFSVINEDPKTLAIKHVAGHASPEQEAYIHDIQNMTPFDFTEKYGYGANDKKLQVLLELDKAKIVEDFTEIDKSNAFEKGVWNTVGNIPGLLVGGVSKGFDELEDVFRPKKDSDSTIWNSEIIANALEDIATSGQKASVDLIKNNQIGDIPGLFLEGVSKGFDEFKDALRSDAFHDATWRSEFIADILKDIATSGQKASVDLIEENQKRLHELNESDPIPQRNKGINDQILINDLNKDRIKELDDRVANGTLTSDQANIMKELESFKNTIKVKGTDLNSILDLTLQGAPSLITTIIAAVASGGSLPAIAATAGFTAGSGAYGDAVDHVQNLPKEVIEQSPSYQEALRQGLTPEEARDAASVAIGLTTALTTAGMIAATSVAIPGSTIVDRILVKNIGTKVTGNIVNKTIRGGLGEGVQEAVQGGTEEVIKDVINDSENILDKKYVGQGAGQGAAEGAIGGIGLGTGAGGAGSILNSVGIIKDNNKENKKTKDQEDIVSSIEEELINTSTKPTTKPTTETVSNENDNNESTVKQEFETENEDSDLKNDTKQEFEAQEFEAQEFEDLEPTIQDNNTEETEKEETNSQPSVLETTELKEAINLEQTDKEEIDTQSNISEIAKLEENVDSNKSNNEKTVISEENTKQDSSNLENKPKEKITKEDSSNLENKPKEKITKEELGLTITVDPDDKDISKQTVGESTREIDIKNVKPLLKNNDDGTIDVVKTVMNIGNSKYTPQGAAFVSQVQQNIQQSLLTQNKEISAKLQDSINKLFELPNVKRLLNTFKEEITSDFQEVKAQAHLGSDKVKENLETVDKEGLSEEDRQLVDSLQLIEESKGKLNTTSESNEEVSKQQDVGKKQSAGIEKVYNNLHESTKIDGHYRTASDYIKVIQQAVLNSQDFGINELGKQVSVISAYTHLRELHEHMIRKVEAVNESSKTGTRVYYDTLLTTGEIRYGEDGQSVKIPRDTEGNLSDGTQEYIKAVKDDSELVTETYHKLLDLVNKHKNDEQVFGKNFSLTNEETAKFSKKDTAQNTNIEEDLSTTSPQEESVENVSKESSSWIQDTLFTNTPLEEPTSENIVENIVEETKTSDDQGDILNNEVEQTSPLFHTPTDGSSKNTPEISFNKEDITNSKDTTKNPEIDVLGGLKGILSFGKLDPVSMQDIFEFVENHADVNSNIYRFIEHITKNAVPNHIKYIEDRLKNIPIDKNSKKSTAEYLIEELQKDSSRIFAHTKLGYLIDPNVIEQAKEEGYNKDSHLLNKDLMDKAIMALYDYIGNRVFRPDVLGTTEEVNERFNLDPETDSQVLIDFLEKGVSLQNLSENISNNILKFWKAKPNPDVSQSVVEQLVGGLTKELIRGISFAENKTQKFVTVVNKDTEFKEIFTDEGYNKLSDKDKEKYISPTYSTYIIVEFDQKKLNTFHGLFAGNTSIFAKILEVTNDLSYFSSEPSKSKDKNINNANRVPHYKNKLLIQLISVLNNTKSTQGNSLLQFSSNVFDFTKQDIHPKIKGKKKGEWVTLESSYQSLKHILYNTIGYSEIFFSNRRVSNGRIIQEGISPQSSTLLRATLTPTKSVVDLTNVKLFNNFLLGLGQELGLSKFDKEDNQVIIETIEKRIQETFPVMLEFIRNQHNYLDLSKVTPLTDYEIEKNGYTLQESIFAAFDNNGMTLEASISNQDIIKKLEEEIIKNIENDIEYTGQALNALNEYSKYLNSGKTTDFITFLPIDVDGASNGFINTIFSFSTGIENIDNINDSLNGAGIFFDDTSSLAEHIKNGGKEIYDLVAEKTQKSIIESYTEGKRRINMFNNIEFYRLSQQEDNELYSLNERIERGVFYFINGFSKVDIEAISNKELSVSISRKDIKSPGLQAIYGAGTNSISKYILDDIYFNIIEDITYDRGDMKELANALNYLLSHGDPNNKFNLLSKNQKFNLTEVQYNNLINRDPKFNLDKKQLKILTNLIDMYYTYHVKAGITQTLGSSADVTENILELSNVMSDIAVLSYQRIYKNVREREFTEGRIRKNDLLTTKGLEEVWVEFSKHNQSLKMRGNDIHINPINSTNRKLFEEAIGNTLTSNTGSTTLDKQEATQATLKAVVDSQARILAVSVVSSLETVVIERLLEKHTDVLQVFDGINIPLNKFEEVSQDLNRIYFEVIKEENLLEDIAVLGQNLISKFNLYDYILQTGNPIINKIKDKIPDNKKDSKRYNKHLESGEVNARYMYNYDNIKSAIFNNTRYDNYLNQKHTYGFLRLEQNRNIIHNLNTDPNNMEYKKQAEELVHTIAVVETFHLITMVSLANINTNSKLHKEWKDNIIPEITNVDQYASGEGEKNGFTPKTPKKDNENNDNISTIEKKKKLNYVTNISTIATSTPSPGGRNIVYHLIDNFKNNYSKSFGLTLNIIDFKNRFYNKDSKKGIDLTSFFTEEQYIVFKSLFKSVPDDYKIIIGNNAQLTNNLIEQKILPENIPDEIIGIMYPEQKVIALSIDADGETFLHEIIHSALNEGISSYDPESSDKHVQRITKTINNVKLLMSDYFNLNFDAYKTRHSLDSLKKFTETQEFLINLLSESLEEDIDINISSKQFLNLVDKLNKRDLHKLLHEFMAYTLSNQPTIKAMSDTPIKNKLINLSKRVIELIRRLLGLDRVNMFSVILLQAKFLSFKKRYNNISKVSEKTLDILIDRFNYTPTNSSLNSLVKKIKDRILTTDTLNKSVTTLKQDEILKAEAAGFTFNDEQRHLFSLIQTILSDDFGKINNDIYVRLEQILSKFRNTLEPTSFKEREDHTDIADQHNSNDKYSYILGLNIEDSSDAIGIILGLVLANNQTRKLFIDNTTEAKKELNNLDSSLQTITDMALTASIKGINNNNADSIDMLEVLTSKLIDISKPFNKGTDILNKGDEFIKGKIKEISKSIYKAGEKFEKKENKFLKFLGSTSQRASEFLNSSDANILAQAQIQFMNNISTDTNNIFNTMREVTSEIIGRLSDNKSVIDGISVVTSFTERLRQEYRVNLPNILRDKFHSIFSEDDWSKLTTGLAKTDILALNSGSINLDLFKWFSPKNRKDLIAEIGRKEKEILAEIKDASASKSIINKSKQLSKYMLTKEAGEMLLTNAKSISLNYNLTTRGKPVEKLNPTLVKSIDELVTLYNIRDVDKETSTFINKLVASKEDQKGLIFLMTYLKSLRNDELAKVDKSTYFLSSYKGYIPSLAKRNYKITIATSFKEKQRLQELGYISLGFVDNKEQGGVKQLLKEEYFITTTRDANTFNQGIIQMIQPTAGGINQSRGNSNSIYALNTIHKREQIRSILSNHRRNQKESTNLIPLFNENNEVIGFDRHVPIQFVNKLKENTTLNELMGVWKGRQIEEMQGIVYNEIYISKLADMWNQEKDTRSREYVNLFDKNLKDKVLKDAIGIINPFTIQEIKKHFDDGQFYVRRDLLHSMLGYRKAGLGDIFTGTSRINKNLRENLKSGLTILLGKNAYNKLLTIQDTSEYIVVKAKKTILIRSLIVPFMNGISNIVQLKTRGINDVSFKLKKKLFEIHSFVKNEQRKIKLEAELLAAKTTNEKTKIKQELKGIEKSNTKMSINPVIGLFSNITEGIAEDDVFPLGASLLDKIEGWVDKLPSGLRTAAKYSVIAEDTALYKGLERSIQYMDFISKSIYYDHLVEKGVDPTEALGQADEEFVNYNINSGRVRDALESLGLTWFLNFAIRSTRVSADIMRNNPLRAILLVTGNLVIDIPSPIFDNIVSKFMKDTLGYSLGIQQLFDAFHSIPLISFTK